MAGTELVDIVDAENAVIGVADVNTAHAEKLMHRVIGIFVFDNKGNLYLQDGNKFGKFDLAVGGHVQRGESYEDAAKREMMEEIGLSVPLVHISTFLPTEARLNHFWSLFSAQAPEDWIFEETEEVKSMQLIPVQEVLQGLESSPEKYTHGLMNAVGEMKRVNAL